MTSRAKPRLIRVLLLLGGNKGDREKTMGRALAALDRPPFGKILARSRLYETAPVGPGRRPFLNRAVILSTLLSPMGLLVEIKRLEAAAGRKAAGRRWGDRPLDIDIIALNRGWFRTPWLEIPHPRARRRAFALRPIRDIAPRWKLQGSATARALLARLKVPPGTVKIYH